MPTNFDRVLFTKQATPTSDMLRFGILLVVVKLLKSISFYLAYNTLTVCHVAVFVFFMRAVAAVFLLLIQKPFSSGRRLTHGQWLRVLRHAFISVLLSILTMYGLTLCGPLRSLMLLGHSDLAVISMATALFTSQVSSTAKVRGAFFFLFGYLGVLLFDHDDTRVEGGLIEPRGAAHSNFVSHLFRHMITYSGLSDHKGGVCLLFLTLAGSVVFRNVSRKLAADIGGGKRLNALSTCISSVIIAPWAFYTLLNDSAAGISLAGMWTVVPTAALCAVFLLVLDYYVEAVCTVRLDPYRTAGLSTYAVFFFAFILHLSWGHPMLIERLPGSVASLNQDSDSNVLSEHAISGGMIFSFVLFLFSTRSLLKPSGRESKGSFVGYSAGGLPLYSWGVGGGMDADRHMESTVYHFLKSGIKQILSDTNSRIIFYFLCVNLAFTFVELTYGVWTNSLGLVSDGFHMLFDCSALIMGLYAAVLSSWSPTRLFSYGYDRVEILSGFINCLFLTIIATFIFLEGIQRLFNPPDINTEKLMVVSVGGLLVNLCGMLVFYRTGHGHSHGGVGGGHGHSHGGGGHGHSHGKGHGHSQEGHGHSHDGHNANMHGVFLHVLADTLGSVGVIVSTVLIERFGWLFADPLCSIFIAVTIAVSMIPLLLETSAVLLLRSPLELSDEISEAKDKILRLDGVLSCRKSYFWTHSSKVICGSVHVLVSPDASEQMITHQVSATLKDIGITHVTVQIEKESFFQHISGLSSGSLAYKFNPGVKDPFYLEEVKSI